MEIVLLPAIALAVLALLVAAACSAAQLIMGIGDAGNAIVLVVASLSAVFCAGVGAYMFL